MKKFSAILLCGMSLAVAGCGDNPFERAASGTVAGGLAAGAPGAVVGGVAGATGAVKVNP